MLEQLFKPSWKFLSRTGGRADAALGLERLQESCLQELAQFGRGLDPFASVRGITTSVALDRANGINFNRTRKE